MGISEQQLATDMNGRWERDAQNKQTCMNYKATLQRLAIRRIEFLEDGKQQVVVVPPEQFSVALRYWRTDTWLERLFCYGLYLIACGWLYVFYRKEQRKGHQA